MDFEEMMMADRGGNVRTAALLEEARLRAGFVSADLASVNFGWDPLIYYRMEQGEIEITLEYAELISSAFEIDIDDLLSKRQFDPSEQAAIEARIEELKERMSPARPPGKQVAARKENASATRTRNHYADMARKTDLEWQHAERAWRLKFAARMRGHTHYDPELKWGVHTDLIKLHEDAKEPFDRRFANAYATAYGVRPSWLTSGKLPSGLGKPVDQRLASLPWRSVFLDDAEDVADQTRLRIDRMQPRDEEAVTALFAFALTGPRENDLPKHGLTGKSLLAAVSRNQPTEVEVLRTLTETAFWLLSEEQQMHFFERSEVRSALSRAFRRDDLPLKWKDLAKVVRTEAYRKPISDDRSPGEPDFPNPT
jgi:hypothetical protein